MDSARRYRVVRVLWSFRDGWFRGRAEGMREVQGSQVLMTVEPSERAYLRQFLEKRFGLDELQTFAFDLGVDYQCLAHTTLKTLSRDLVAYFERRDQLGYLVSEVLKYRPDSSLAQLLANQLSGYVPTIKVQVILSGVLPMHDGLDEQKDQIAEVFGVDRDEVVLVGAAPDSMRLQASLPRRAGYTKAIPGVDGRVIHIPVIGRITAGFPILGAHQPDDIADGETISIAAGLLPGCSDLYALRVTGDSLLDAMIFDGDRVIIEHQNAAQQGDMVVAWLKECEMITLRYYYLEGFQVWLRPAHPGYEAACVPINQVEILGKVVLVLRKLS
jgi:SOS-response transcriptional repressor LexA